MVAFSWSEFAVLFGAAVIGIACVTPYSLELTADAINKALERMRRPRWVLILLQSAQGAVLLGVATGLGLLIAPHRLKASYSCVRSNALRKCVRSNGLK